ncbi:MAG: heat shock protein GrpE [Firmicutes bacterium ADurb.Bin456]|nr:MAG: heat shock protein GrpE [Firmicutes bacterium ADurb.Bin456]
MTNEDKNRFTDATREDEIFDGGDNPAIRKGKDRDPAEQDLKGTSGEAKEADLTLLQKQLGDAEARADDFFKRLARLQADYENFRRRSRQEKEDLHRYASEQLVLRLLPVLDNFERALTAGGDSLQDYRSGVEMIYRQLLDVLSLEGVTAIPAVGEIFDPVKHEAVLRELSDEYPENTITEEFRRGYLLKDRVIRPAMVKVSNSL